jgi:hypothetical protein
MIAPEEEGIGRRQFFDTYDRVSENPRPHSSSRQNVRFGDRTIVAAQEDLVACAVQNHSWRARQIEDAVHASDYRPFRTGNGLHSLVLYDPEPMAGRKESSVEAWNMDR